MSNQDDIKLEFDLFSRPETDDLKEHLAKGSYQWTNKYTKILAGAFIVVTLLSIGAWYGHYSATKSTTNSAANSLNSLRAAFGGSFGAGGTSSQSGGGGALNGGGFGGIRVSGTITKVNGSEITVKADDPTQLGSLKEGDAARLTDTGVSAVTSRTSNSPTKSNKASATPKPSVSGGSTSNGTGQRRGFFGDPTVQACLKKNGVDLTSGVRPDRTDPKVAAAFQKCIPNFGQGGFRAPATP
jgi:hypothetical protein